MPWKFLRADGACMINGHVQRFGIEMHDENICKNEHESFQKIINTILSMSGYSSYYPFPKSDSMSSILSDGSLKLVYKLLSSADRKHESTNEEHIQTIVKRQRAL